jgi:hypothetical protein
MCQYDETQRGAKLTTTFLLFSLTSSFKGSYLSHHGLSHLQHSDGINEFSYHGTGMLGIAL